ncbi:MinD/ParA family ATP-binding protein [Variovorax ginsengisoli]|uniref:Flagellar biosynthesis protein FlhG n=1 Tax=Variovorax ginsengisoli TaxID=363844 RepID=A0ABT9SD82_9BURK|nr:flagellar biosynthesis protein FlhG [Variovorax ginsengisoli]MDP9902322.1 flagellar biosynthesis protein FlhG [Variovorax ginsengisoli]
MSPWIADQAEGLRRLLVRTPTRVVAVANTGWQAGSSTAVRNLGAAMVRQGKDVTILTEYAEGTMPPEALAAVVTGNGAGHPGSLTLRSASAVDTGAVAALCSQARCDVVLIDAALDAAGGLSPLGCAADEVMLVLKPTAPSITSTFSGIKRLHQAHALRQLRVLVNGVTGVDQARQIMRNLDQAGSRYLTVALRPAGWIRFDPHVVDARLLGENVVDSFPGSEAAEDFRRVADGIWRWTDVPAAISPRAGSGQSSSRSASLASGLRPALHAAAR